MLKESYRMAISSIMGNKMRSFLTMLGVLIGVFAVIALISLGNGASSMVTDELGSAGVNTVTVMSLNKDLRLYDSDFDNILERAEIASYTPVVSGNIVLEVENESFRASVQGVNENFSSIRKLDLTSGRFLNALEIENNASVAVIDVNTAEKLFPYESSIGQTISIKGTQYEVVGVLEEETMDATSMMGTGDGKIIIPVEEAKRIFRTRSAPVYYVESISEDSVATTSDEIEKLLDQKSEFLSGSNNYYVLAQSSLVDMSSSILGMLTTFVAAIAGVSLLVGGIGIMNIMLVSVTERTREIGVRKAVGATRRNILTQFLIESSIITLIGGLLGLGLSAVVLWMVERFADFSAPMGVNVILIAIGFSVAIGLIFGLYPANKAAGLKPVDALRFE